MRIHSINIVNLRNNEHFQFVKDVAALLKTIPETVAAKIARQIDALAAAIADEDTVLKKIMKSVLTAQIHDADEARDDVYRGLVNAAAAARHHFTAGIRRG